MYTRKNSVSNDDTDTTKDEGSEREYNFLNHINSNATDYEKQVCEDFEMKELD